MSRRKQSNPKPLKSRWLLYKFFLLRGFVVMLSLLVGDGDNRLIFVSVLH